jgi:hypothetical protein
MLYCCTTLFLINNYTTQGIRLDNLFFDLIYKI